MFEHNFLTLMVDTNLIYKRSQGKKGGIGESSVALRLRGKCQTLIWTIQDEKTKYLNLEIKS